jgi:hypothetical protein
MRHLVSFGFLVLAIFAYGLSLGPLSFAAPVLAGVLVLIGVVLEGSFWLRLAHPSRR